MKSRIRNWLLKKLGGVDAESSIELVDKATSKIATLTKERKDLYDELVQCRKDRDRRYRDLRIQFSENVRLNRALDQACEAWLIKTKPHSELVITSRIYSQLVPSSYTIDRPELEQALRARGKVV